MGQLFTTSTNPSTGNESRGRSEKDSTSPGGRLRSGTRSSSRATEEEDGVGSVLVLEEGLTRRMFSTELDFVLVYACYLFCVSLVFTISVS